jgi:hypothetical protein
MLIDPGQPQEEIHFESQNSCFGSDSGNRWEQNWLNEWTTWFHGRDKIGEGGAGAWYIDGFTPAERPIVGRRTFTMVVGARTLDETWEVVHTPDRS